MQNAISVSRYNAYIKQIFDAEELLHGISIVGEVFDLSFSRQVAYFSLKDEFSSLPCVCFNAEVALTLKEGDSVVVSGSPNYYTKGGKLSFVVNTCQPAGLGELYQRFLMLKEKLESEGLFATEHKKSMPKHIQRIGVITSKEGAVIRDIINVATRRNPSVDIVLFPVKVQGIGAEDEISYAIEKLSNYQNIDVIVVARGGGSLEDLWAYNTEKVARATFECSTPIVSAVGHETDFTIIDFVSDLRAPTPSAAAELLTEDITEKKSNLLSYINRFLFTAQDYIEDKIEESLELKENLVSSFEAKTNAGMNKFTKLTSNFKNSCERFSQALEYQLGILNNSLYNLSPQKILKRGYAKIEQEGKVIDRASDIVLSSNIEINFIDGKVIAKAIDKKENK